MEARFHDVPCDPPKLPKEQKARRSQLKKWLGSSAKEIFSIGFSLYKGGELDEKKVDAFCSENLLRHVLLLSQVNELAPEDFEFLNKFLEKELLPYLLLKYPLSEEKETSRGFAGKIVEVDNKLSNENDLIFRSKVKF